MPMGLVDDGEQVVDRATAGGGIGVRRPQRVEGAVDGLVHDVPVGGGSRLQAGLGRVPGQFQVLDARLGGGEVAPVGQRLHVDDDGPELGEVAEPRRRHRGGRRSDGGVLHRQQAQGGGRGADDRRGDGGEEDVSHGRSLRVVRRCKDWRMGMREAADGQDRRCPAGSSGRPETRLRDVTRATMTAKKTRLVAAVPNPRPPYSRACDSRSPSDAPRGRVTM